MRKLPLRTIFVPIIIVVHFIPFYYLTMKYNESPQLQEEEVKKEEAKEESVEFEEEKIEEIPEDEYTSPQELAAVNELINSKPKTKEIQQFREKNVQERVQSPLASSEKKHKTHEKQQESYHVNTPSSVSDTKEEQSAEKTFENSEHALYDNITSDEYQQYYESYINAYSMNGDENGMPKPRCTGSCTAQGNPPQNGIQVNHPSSFYRYLRTRSHTAYLSYCRHRFWNGKEE
ncbi:MAG: hypothetical protein E3K37_02415 [Candidatus Kuenenia sp.]|nr:hypothetical protein [Candidatus Kuenenia hertensis]